jgi:hypothetical protein
MRGLESTGSGYGPVEGSCEHGNEPSGSIKCERLLASQGLLHGVICMYVMG